VSTQSAARNAGERGLDSLDVIKIDIEGREPLAWPGIDVLVRKHRPRAFTEFNPVAIRSHAREVVALHLDGPNVSCASPAEIMEQWRDANRRQVSVDSYHRDLYFDART
jgi:hypothetical protein